MKRLRALALILALLIVCLVSCHDDCPKNTLTCPSCPTEASSCSTDCDEVKGARVDVQRQCRTPAEVIACQPHHDEEAPSQVCSVRVSDGAAFLIVGGSVAGTGWRGCSQSEKDSVELASFCP